MRVNLKNRRISYGYTRESFAEMLGISRVGYDHIESGRRMPREKVLKLILKLLETESMTLFDNEKVVERGEVSRNICKYMNLLSTSKVYTAYHVNAIRRCLSIELKQRKEKGISCSSRSKNGKHEIYKRVAALVKEEFNQEVTGEDVRLYKKCVRQEYTDRTGKCTWSIPQVRKRLGHNPVTGY